MKSCLECEHGYTGENRHVVCIFHSYIIAEPEKEAKTCEWYKHDDYSFGEEKTMNMIPKIAEMLGVEIGEEFEVLPENAGPGYKSSRYRFSESRLEYSNYIHYPSETGWSPTDTITGLLNGKISIVKLPFEPKPEEKYYTVRFYANELVICDREFRFEMTPLADKYCGNCFRTEAEAEAHKFEVYERLTGRKWEEE